MPSLCRRLRILRWPLLVLVMVLLGAAACAVPVPVVPGPHAPVESAETPPLTPPASPCTSETAAPVDPAFLESLQPIVERIELVDPPGDFILDHLLYEENFDAPGVFEERPIPMAMDLVAVSVGPEGDAFLFTLTTEFANQPEGDSLAALLEPGRRSAAAGIYLDVDRNGSSEYLITTTDESLDRAIALDAATLEPVAEIPLVVEESTLSMLVPAELAGDRFDWVVFTSYTPLEGRVFLTPLDWVFILPAVDIFAPSTVPVNVGFSTGYRGTGVQCQVTSTTYNSCPVQGNPAQVAIPGASTNGVLLYRVVCDGRGYALWCVGQSAFGKQVILGTPAGWVARCPYTCGYNQEGRWDQNADGLVDKIIHTVTDNDCASHHDQDSDGKLDVMEHSYLYATNQVVSCNRERDYVSNATLAHWCKSPHAPYSQLYDVPPPVPTPSP